MADSTVTISMVVHCEDEATWTAVRNYFANLQPAFVVTENAPDKVLSLAITEFHDVAYWTDNP